MSILKDDLSVLTAVEIHYQETQYTPGARTETEFENENTGEKVVIRVETEWNGDNHISERQAW